MSHTLTTIDIQGDEQEVFEVYATPEREITIGYVYDEADAKILPHARELAQALTGVLKALRQSRFKMNVRKDFSLMNAEACASRALFRLEAGQ